MVMIPISNTTKRADNKAQAGGLLDHDDNTKRRQMAYYTIAA